MTRLLRRAVGHFRSDGFVPAHAAGYRTRLEAIGAAGRLPGGGLRCKSPRLVTCVGAFRHLLRGTDKAM